jgi:hypothetical protein
MLDAEEEEEDMALVLVVVLLIGASCLELEEVNFSFFHQMKKITTGTKFVKVNEFAVKAIAKSEPSGQIIRREMEHRKGNGRGRRRGRTQDRGGRSG